MKLVLNLLFLVLFSFGLSAQMSAGDLSRQEKDHLLVPIKMINYSPEENSTTTLEYDSLVRIIKVKTIFSEADNTVKYTIDRIVTYDDQSQQYRKGDAYIVASVEVIVTNNNYVKPIVKMHYDFNYKRVSPVEYSIEANDGYSVTNYSVDAESGHLIDTKICKSDDDSMCFFTEFIYDNNGNVSKIMYKQGPIVAMNITNTYDDKRGVCCNIHTPKWLFYQYLSPISSFGLVNNKVSQISDDECKVNVMGTYLYNSDGYPIKYTTATSSPVVKSVLCFYPNDLDYTIEYVSIDALKEDYPIVE